MHTNNFTQWTDIQDIVQTGKNNNNMDKINTYGQNIHCV